MIVELQRGRLAGTIGLALRVDQGSTVESLADAISRHPGISWVRPVDLHASMRDAVVEAAGELPVIVERDVLSLWDAAWSTWPVALVDAKWTARTAGELATEMMSEHGAIVSPAEALVMLGDDDTAAASVTPLWLDQVSQVLSWTSTMLGSLCWSGSPAMRQRLAQAIAASRTPWRLDR